MKRILLAFSVLSLIAGCTGEKPVTAIDLNKSELTIEKGSIEILKVQVTPSDAVYQSLTWTSSNPAVASVTPNDAEGIVLGVDAGSAEITAQCGELQAKCLVTVIISAQGITLNYGSIILSEGGAKQLEASVTPANSTDAVVWSSSDESVVTVESTGLAKAVAAGNAVITATAGSFSATCNVTVRAPKADGAVDLGVSVYWGSCNVGALNPQDAGSYFAWGEIEPKSLYNWTTYKWCEGTYTTLTKYNYDSKYGVVDDKRVLEAEDDVATATLGGSWRMPTYEECLELLESCNWTWTEYEGKKGYMVTSKTNSGNWIFLPAAGEMMEDKLYTLGQKGFYRSSTLHYPTLPWNLYLSESSTQLDGSSFGRTHGYSIRPVCPK